jgi:PilZ domain
MKERRKYERFIIEGMDVQCRMFFTTEVKIRDISFGGVALSLTKRLNMGQEYTLKIESENNTISLKGVVVWENMTSHTREVKGRQVPIYEVGIKFHEVLTEKGSDLINFLSGNISDKTIKTRVQGFRVKIVRAKETVILDDRDSYYVKMIGLGGMLIESKEELDTEARFQMEMSFPEEVKPIKFLGRTAYCMEMPGKTPKCYEAGIEFMEMSEEDRVRLKALINMLRSI